MNINFESYPLAVGLCMLMWYYLSISYYIPIILIRRIDGLFSSIGALIILFYSFILLVFHANIRCMNFMKNFVCPVRYMAVLVQSVF